MPSKKLATLLSALSGHDLNRFRKFLSSPYFNEHQELVILLDLLINTPDEPLEDSAARKKAIWKKLFNKKAYNDGYMRRLISELIRLLLSFMALERYRKNPIQEQLLLLDLLNEPAYKLHFAGVLRNSETLQEKSNFRDSYFHFYQYLLDEQLYKYIEKSDRNPEMLKNLEDADYHLDCYYITKKLQHYCDALGYRNFLPVEENINLPPDFMNWLQQSAYIKEPAVKSYFLVAQLFLHPDESTFYYELKNLLKEKGHLFQINELKAIYIHLINYCIDIKINKGFTDFFNELFDIYKNMLNKTVLIENNMIDPQHYKLIISVGLQVNEFDWVKDFIQTYTDKLPPEEQANARIYNLAKVHFQQQHYNKVIELLREVEYENITYALGGKLMLLKTYYELNEFLALDSLIDSFRIYLRRNKLISKEVRQQYLNVLRFVKKLSNTRPKDQKAIANVRQEIDACRALADKNWILQKLEDLSN
ncbi:MAG: hypothetical protein IPJ74_10705 [Saprospiraceae bacterium]|nr:hypothetical protein [Saprospiraceae bacterium]